MAYMHDLVGHDAAKFVSATMLAYLKRMKKWPRYICHAGYEPGCPCRVLIFIARATPMKRSRIAPLYLSCRETIDAFEEFRSVDDLVECIEARTRMAIGSIIALGVETHKENGTRKA